MKYLILITLLTFNVNLSAGDLDDGIQLDEPINDDINLDVNIQFIKQRAKAAAGAAEDGDNDKIKVNTACGGTGNQTFGPGANLQGATIVNLSDNKGSSTVCGGR